MKQSTKEFFGEGINPEVKIIRKSQLKNIKIRALVEECSLDVSGINISSIPYNYCAEASSETQADLMESDMDIEQKTIKI